MLFWSSCLCWYLVLVVAGTPANNGKWPVNVAIDADLDGRVPDIYEHEYANEIEIGNEIENYFGINHTIESNVDIEPNVGCLKISCWRQVPYCIKVALVDAKYCCVVRIILGEKESLFKVSESHRNSNRDNPVDTLSGCGHKLTTVRLFFQRL